MMATRARVSSLLPRLSDLRHSRLSAAAFSVRRDHPCRSIKPLFPSQYRILPPKLVGINIVPSQIVYIVERDGKYHRTLDSGLHFLNPFTDKIAHVHSLKELLVSPEGRHFKTLDNILVYVLSTLRLKIVDPLRASYEVAHPMLATLYIFEAKLSSQIRSVTQEKLLEQFDILFDDVVRRVNAATAEWGVECLRCEIGELSFVRPEAISESLRCRGEIQSPMDREGSNVARFQLMSDDEQGGARLHAYIHTLFPSSLLSFGVIDLLA